MREKLLRCIVKDTNQGATMIKFNDLLLAEGVDPSEVKLIRHSESSDRQTTFDLWSSDPNQFFEFERLQGKPIYKYRPLAASFVVTPPGGTLFVGLREIRNVRIADKKVICPLHKVPRPGLKLYDIVKRSELVEYEGRLSIDWGLGTRSWYQYADRHSKPVISISATDFEMPFPGFSALQFQLDELTGLPEAWRNSLSSVGGVYLLVCPDTGEQYVGSAYGEFGFFGRWSVYSKNGHGGNKFLRKRGRHNYRIGVLEVVPNPMSPDEVIRREAFWKEKLGSRAHGLNAN